MNNVRIGIIGIGNMGSAHARSIFSGLIPRMTLTQSAISLLRSLNGQAPICPERLNLQITASC